MPGILRCQGSTLILLLGMWAAVSGCEPFDNTRREIPRGTLGEELYKVACERLVSEQMPEDVSGAQARALCHPNASASTAPAGRIRALIENRTRLVEALDRTLPASLEDELQNLLVAMLPFYDAPSELLPSNTRAIGKLLGDLMAEDDVLAALGRMSQRRGMRQPLNALGLVRPILTYPGLPDLTTAMLARIDDGGALEPEWKAVLEAAALEMATAEPSAPDDETLSIVRDLVLRRNAVFGSETPHDLYVVERDSRGLPVPAFLDGSQGFVDLDTDGLADADELGRFLAADGSLLNPATPFPVIDESGVSRD
ncbi:MAG: hypothetical protein H5U40_08080, partial [Polyangiaceae bacterium]|nr:hypothetical protein [Polyangiaceae bacterium]